MSSKVALVTGGTGGIGTAICEELSAQGYAVVTNYRNEESARQWQQERRAKGFEIGLVPGNVADFESSAKMVAAVEEGFGRIAVLVNNAGITRDTTFRKMTVQQWRDVMQTNLDSLFNVTRNVIDKMLESNFGRIINISSINGQKGQFGQVNYSASKSGVHGFTMALAQEVARKNITVNTVSPGYIATEMVMAVPEDVRNKIIAQIPVGRLGEPEEVARLIAFLADAKTGFITGADLSINGGQYMS